MLLYAITDRQWLNNRPLEEVVELALIGGVTMLQLREKHQSKEQIIKQAKSIKKICNRYDVPLIINDSVDICIASHADGVHIGQKDGSVSLARQQLGKDCILGVTANRVHLAIQAQEDGADYIGAGAVFGSNTKLDAQYLDKTTCANISQNISIPMVAIGGINHDNISNLQGYGMNGFAVISAIFASSDITLSTQLIKQKAIKVLNNEI